MPYDAETQFNLALIAWADYRSTGSFRGREYKAYWNHRADMIHRLRAAGCSPETIAYWCNQLTDETVGKGRAYA